MQNSIAAETNDIVPSIHPLSPLNGSMQIAKDFSIDCTIRLIENNENYIVIAKISNIRKEDIRVSVYGNRVVLGATRLVFSSFKRTLNPRSDIRKISIDNEDVYIIHNFIFDRSIEVSRSQATYKNGELKLLLPKDSKAGRRLLIN
ncbi:MAG: Hsp20/alpha crystallin family protein [Spongiibacteraceae bacterium]